MNSDSTPLSAQQLPRYVFAILLVCLLVALFFAGKWGLAAASHTIATQHFNSWIENNQQPERGEWNSTRAMMFDAIRLDPDNAEYSNNAGLLFEYAANHHGVSEQSQSLLLEKSLAYFQKSTELSPTWPVPWANTALIKSYLDIVDQEYFYALEMSMTLGSSQPVIHGVITAAALAHWQELSPSLQQKVIHQIEAGLHSMNRSDVFKAIRFYKMCREFEEILKFNCRD